MPVPKDYADQLWSDVIVAALRVAAPNSGVMADRNEIRLARAIARAVECDDSVSAIVRGRKRFHERVERALEGEGLRFESLYRGVADAGIRYVADLGSSDSFAKARASQCLEGLAAGIAHLDRAKAQR
jgi:hypothetical protein